MADYTYDKNDGLLHTRYSEVSQCSTPRAALAVARQKVGLTKRIETKPMRFGTMMHDVWSQETEQTGRTPACFADGLQFDEAVAQHEVQQATILFEGVVYHFTIDAVTDDAAIIDYKTGTEGNGWMVYKSSLQIPTYALLIRAHGLKPTKGYYLCQLWDQKRTQVTSYRLAEVDITVGRLADAKAMLRKNTQNLIEALSYLAKIA